MEQFDCIIIGGGAAGLFCASVLSPQKKVAVIEKNRILGKKLLITGKGRCNLTNASDMTVHMKNVRTNAPFLYSAFSSLSAYDVMDFFESEGLSLKTERGNRVFPSSNLSRDVVEVLCHRVQDNGHRIFCDEVVSVSKDLKFRVQGKNKTYAAENVVIATGCV